MDHITVWSCFEQDNEAQMEAEFLEDLEIAQMQQLANKNGIKF